MVGGSLNFATLIIYFEQYIKDYDNRIFISRIHFVANHKLVDSPKISNLIRFKI